MEFKIGQKIKLTQNRVDEHAINQRTPHEFAGVLEITRVERDYVYYKTISGLTGSSFKKDCILLKKPTVILSV